MRIYLSTIAGGIVCLAGFAVSSNAQERKPIRIVGDETLATKVKASPKDFLDRSVVMTGGIQIDDYYNFGYDNAEESHYSLAFQQVISDPPQKLGERFHVYLRRDDKEGVSKQIVDKLIADSPDRATMKRIRVRVALASGRYENGAWDLFELMDVQFATADGNGWGPWVVESERDKQRQSAQSVEKAAAAAAIEEKKRRDQEKQKRDSERKAALTRVWNDASGTFSVKAEFAGLIGAKVKLLKPDGTTITVEIDKLSKADRDWIRTRK